MIIYKVADEKLIEEVVDPKDWNEVHIKANGPDIEIKINGVSTAKFTEKGDVPSSGCICLQVHAGDLHEIRYKNIVLNQLEH